MIRFRTFLLEYLTDEQRNRHKDVHMTDKARADTDPFFGVGNDKVHGEIQHDEKSEIHHQLENHLGRDLSHEEYKTGVTKDKYGRDVKLGRLIKDDNLRNQFDKDPSRKIMAPSVKTTTVRGVEVAGQTNPVPNTEHPNGHAWHDMSCKNIENGMNRHYLGREITHGTVVHFVHDHNGQEIYRATLQPHHNNEGHTAYSVDAEYGIKHPEFTKSAHKVAAQLSGEHKPGYYEKSANVYNDNGLSLMLHPKASVDDVHTALKDSDPKVNLAASVHPNLSGHALDAALKHDDAYVRKNAATHQNTKGETLNNILKTGDGYVTRSAIDKNPNITKEHLHTTLDHNNDPHSRSAAFKHSKIDVSHITKGLNDEDPNVRGAAIFHSKANEQHIDKASRDSSKWVRRAALTHKNRTPNNIDKWLDSDDHHTVETAAVDPKASNENLTKAMHMHADVAYTALDNPNIKQHHLEMALKHNDPTVRRAAVRHDLMTSDMLHHVLDNEPDPSVRKVVFRNAKADITHAAKGMKDPAPEVRARVVSDRRVRDTHIEKALNDESPKVRVAALSNMQVNLSPEQLHKAVRDPDEDVRDAAIRHWDIKPEHLEHAAANDPLEHHRALAAQRLIKMNSPGW